MWVKWIQTYLICDENFLSIKDKTSKGSWMWKKILKYREMAQGFFKKEVKNGSQTSFWFGNQSQHGRIYNLTGQRWVIDTGIPITATAEEALKNRRRRRHRADHLIAIENLLLQQEHILVNEEKDKPLWKQSEDTYKDCHVPDPILDRPEGPWCKETHQSGRKTMRQGYHCPKGKLRVSRSWDLTRIWGNK